MSQYSHIKDPVQGGAFDYIHVPYNPAVVNSLMGYARTGYYHVHGRAITYPSLALPITITSGSGVYGTTGAKIEVIPAGVLTLSAFDLHWINISDISAVAHFDIDIYSGAPGAEVWIGGTKGWRTSNFVSEGAKRIQIPQQPAGTRISVRLSDSTSGTITVAVSFEGHYYAN